MPASFQILQHRRLALFTYAGFVTISEAQTAICDCWEHPKHHPSMRQFCDLSAVTGVERNFPELLKMQAKIAEEMGPAGPELLVMFYAPNRAGQELAQMARKSWEGLDSVIVLIQETEADALAVLGLPEASIADLMASVG